MTSRISFFKMIKSDLKRRLWVVSLLFLGFFAVMPVEMMMTVERLYEDMTHGIVKWEEIILTIVYRTGAGNELVIIGVICSAVLAAFSGFSFLHSSRKLDLFHSFAVKRERLFAVQYVSGLIVFLIPYGINEILSLIVCVINGVATRAVLGSMLAGILIHLVYFLLIYHVVIIAIIMTGRLLVSILGVLVFCGWSLLTSTTINYYISNCFHTYYPLKRSVPEKVFDKLSPIQQYFECAGKDLFYENSSVGAELLKKGSLNLAIALAEAAVLLVIALWLYKKRPSEAAGSSMAFPKWNPVIKVMILIPVSAFGGILISSGYGNESFAWVVFGILFAVVVGHCLIEVIYSYDFKKVLSHKVTLGISLAATMIFVGICWFDLVGYDEKLPDMEKLQSMAVSIEISDRYTEYLMETKDDDYYSYNDKEVYRLTHGQMTDMTAAYQLAKFGVENEKTDYFDTEENIEGTSIFVSYMEQGGKELTRRYIISYDQLKQCIGLLYETDGFKNGEYPILNLDVEQTAMNKIVFDDAYHSSEEMDLSLQEKKELVSCYQQELSKVTYEEMQPENVVAVFRVLDMDDCMMMGDCVIYDSFEKTIALMEQYGYPVQRIPDEKDVASISIYNYAWEEEMNASGEAEVAVEMSAETIFEEPEDIREILDALVNYESEEYLLENGYEVDVEINFEGEKGKHYLNFPGRFKKDEVPQCVLDAYENR